MRYKEISVKNLDSANQIKEINQKDGWTFLGYLYHSEDDGLTSELTGICFKKEDEIIMNCQITFNASGWVKQNVKIIDPNVTADELEQMLKSGEAITTIQDDGVIINAKDSHVIGVMEQVNNDCEYTDFEVEKI
jgi:hypothetical protein